jgi:hypothetical protein
MNTVVKYEEGDRRDQKNNPSKYTLKCVLGIVMGALGFGNVTRSCNKIPLANTIGKALIEVFSTILIVGQVSRFNCGRECSGSRCASFVPERVC